MSTGEKTRGPLHDHQMNGGTEAPLHRKSAPHRSNLRRAHVWVSSLASRLVVCISSVGEWERGVRGQRV